MITKFNKIEVKTENEYGLKYLNTRHGWGCSECQDACNGLIGQVDVLALPYTVNEVEEEPWQIKSN